MSSKKRFYKELIVLYLGLIIYLVTVMAEDTMWNNIVSPTLAALVAGIILLPLKKEMNYFGGRILLGLMAVSWVIADLGWLLVDNIMGLNASRNELLLWLYAVPNVFMASATALYFYKNYKKWHLMYLVINIVTTLVVIFGIVWFFVSNQIGVEGIGGAKLMATYVYLIFDAVAITILITIRFLTKKSAAVPKPIVLVAVGVLLYAVTDLYYSYLLIYNYAFDIDFVDAFYMVAMVLFATASIMTFIKPVVLTSTTSTGDEDAHERSFNLLYLTAVPLGSLLLGITGLWQSIHLMIVVVIAQVISGYIQTAIQNEYMLKKETQMKLILEREVLARTLELQEKNAVLTELSTLDALTGLYNRRYFIEQLDEFIHHRGTPLAMLFMDLDRFKAINDSHGHEMGDRVLEVISKRLREWAPQDVILSRLGGDEFVVLVTGDIQEARLIELCEAIITLCKTAIEQPPYVFHLGVSIGIAQYPKDAAERDLLMKYADIAMYHVKKDYYSDRYVFFSSWLSEKIVRHHQLELMLRDVKFDDSFELHYQPLYGLNEEAVIGAEALLRWHTAEGHFISPMEFIPIAEEIGLIIDIGKWVMHRAFGQAAAWNTRLDDAIKIGINLSPKQIDAVDFLASLHHALEQYKVNSEWIDLEITENCAMNMDLRMDEILSRLDQMGISVSLDDFGTGYSSLSYIKQFDISRLKIAKELVDHIETDDAALTIVQAIIMMAKGMSLRTIAEGVESEKQMSLLKSIGCDEIQGYYFGRPVTAEAFETMYLRDRMKDQGGVS